MEDNNTHETVRQERVQIEIPTEATLPAYAKEVVNTPMETLPLGR